eukprot:Colp12_sorted_trinity150504_noHs@9829
MSLFGFSVSEKLIQTIHDRYKVTGYRLRKQNAKYIVVAYDHQLTKWRKGKPLSLEGKVLAKADILKDGPNMRLVSVPLAELRAQFGTTSVEDVAREILLNGETQDLSNVLRDFGSSFFLLAVAFTLMAFFLIVHVGICVLMHYSFKLNPALIVAYALAVPPVLFWFFFVR